MVCWRPAFVFRQVSLDGANHLFAIGIAAFHGLEGIVQRSGCLFLVLTEDMSLLLHGVNCHGPSHRL